MVYYTHFWYIYRYFRTYKHFQSYFRQYPKTNHSFYFSRCIYFSIQRFIFEYLFTRHLGGRLTRISLLINRWLCSCSIYEWCDKWFNGSIWDWSILFWYRIYCIYGDDVSKHCRRYYDGCICRIKITRLI